MLFRSLKRNLSLLLSIMLNALNVIIMGMLQQIAEADCFSHKQADSTQIGTLVSLRDIIFHATGLVIKQLIAIEERIEEHSMILMLTFLFMQDVIPVTSMDM